MSTISRDHASPLTMVPVPGPIGSSWQVFGRRRFAADSVYCPSTEQGVGYGGGLDPDR